MKRLIFLLSIFLMFISCTKDVDKTSVINQKSLDLQVDRISNWKCKFTLNYNGNLVRAGNIICGQAIVSAADTAMIVAVISAIGKYEEITTVDISCKYLRPLSSGGSIETEILKLGKRLVVGRITVKDIKSDKLAAEISCTYARL